ncbi:DNA polymerase beta [Perkinsela sp. CCAP 1560/4]|nr:DNA polymerase beta [Perkinsela sp. CCAP 1560/4]KNH06513.1 DNA polymerase beta [Perkinsela sp. CCAP 1560/4]|eukprot:KNH04695.1 DNA polymerase beta [Perkinsela sp. CCAP 1560/4]
MFQITNRALANAKLIDMLRDLSTVATLDNEVFRARGFINAIKVLRCSDEIRTREDVEKLRIGDKMKMRFLEYIRTRELRECIAIHRKPGMAQFIAFGRIPYMTHKLAHAAAFKHKFSNYKELLNLPITPMLRNSITHYEDSQLPIPRHEITILLHALEKIARKALSNKIRIMACGSYRRQLPQSKDIDVLITGPRNNLEQCIHALKSNGFLTTSIRHGPVMFSGYCQLRNAYFKGTRKALSSSQWKEMKDRDYHPVRRIDIRWFSPKNFWPAVVYFTGSANLNIEMRCRAQEKGLHLNEYGISSSKNKKKEAIHIGSEKALFRLVGMPYVEPKHRSI